MFGRWVWLPVWLLISKGRNKLSRKSENYRRVTENMFTQMAWSLCHLLNWLWRNQRKHCAFKSASRDVVFFFFTLLYFLKLWADCGSNSETPIAPHTTCWRRTLSALLPGDFVASQASELWGICPTFALQNRCTGRMSIKNAVTRINPCFWSNFILHLLLISSLKVAADTQNKQCETSLPWCFV